ncbi:unnamed protein product, partial [Ixodes pacificus]
NSSRQAANSSKSAPDVLMTSRNSEYFHFDRSNFPSAFAPLTCDLESTGVPTSSTTLLFSCARRKASSWSRDSCSICWFLNM